MRALLAVALLLLAGCAAPPSPREQASPLQEPVPLRLLGCTVETRYLASTGFVAGRAALDRAAWAWGVNPLPAAQDAVPTRLKVPLVDPLPAGWSALAVGLQVRTRTGTAAVPPVAEAPIILSEPGTYVHFRSPMPPGFLGGARAIDLALDAEHSPRLPGLLVFDSTFLATGPGGIDLALISEPGAHDPYGEERLSRLDAFYCGGERLSLADFLGYDFDKGGYER